MKLRQSLPRVTCCVVAFGLGQLLATSIAHAQADAPEYIPSEPLPPGMQAPPEYRYTPGTLLPKGYHIEERPRRGFLITGYLVAGIPYGAGLLTAAATGFSNESHYLVLPIVGPWLSLGLDNDSECGLMQGRSSEDPSTACDLQIAGDALLLSDGILQMIGGTFVVLGYTLTRPYAVRDEAWYAVMPSPVGSGYGFALFGAM
jgi:hypothetical protein